LSSLCHSSIWVSQVPMVSILVAFSPAVLSLPSEELCAEVGDGVKG
jgi:hypothetical protein